MSMKEGTDEATEFVKSQIGGYQLTTEDVVKLAGVLERQAESFVEMKKNDFEPSARMLSAFELASINLSQLIADRIMTSGIVSVRISELAGGIK